MKDFNKGKSFGSGRDRNRNGGFGGRPSFGGRDRGGNRGGFGGGGRGATTMHSAICGNCGNTCEVPFRPTGDKPVLCNDCFAKERESGRSFEKRGGNNRPERNDRNDRGSNNNDDLKRQIDALHTKLDALMSQIMSGSTSKDEVKKTKTVAKKPVEKTENKATAVKKATKKVAKKAPVKKVAKKAAKKK